MTPRHDAYGEVARHYDLHDWDWYARTYGPRLVNLLRERGLAAGASILDAGCGTGSLALLLAQAGYRVTGVDLSPEMIERARLKDPNHAVDWRVGDLTTLDLGVPFDATVSVADVFNHLETLDEWEAALRSLHRHLRPGGFLYLDAMTCKGLEQMDVQSVQERGGVTLIVAIVYEPVARRSTLKVVSFVPAPSGAMLFERARQTITEWGHPVETIVRRCVLAGFSDVERLWPSAENPEDDDRLSLLARS